MITLTGEQREKVPNKEAPFSSYQINERLLKNV